MNKERKTAIWVGVLFIVALVFNLIAMGVYQPILSGENYLRDAQPDRMQAVIGVILDLICGPAILLIPIVAFPILKIYSLRLAVAYIGFRAVEVVFHMAHGLKTLSIINLSQAYIEAGSPSNSWFETQGQLIHAQNDWSTLIYIMIFTIGGLMFYVNLYGSRVVPRWISVWGFAAVSLLLAGSIIGLLGLMPLGSVMSFFGPAVALNELTLSVWLITKGFNKHTLHSASANPESL